MSNVRYPQFCALARAAEIIGERWTLLIIRELFLGPKRFTDLAERLDTVSPTLLAARLKMLTENGVIRRATLPAPARAEAYELTETGLSLKPAILELIRWGGRFLFPPEADEKFDPDWTLLALTAVAQRAPAPDCRITLRIKHGGKAGSFIIEGGPSGTTIARGEAPDGPVIETRFDDLLRILAGDVSIDRALAAKKAKTQGSLRILRQLPRLFELGGRRDEPAGGRN